MRWRINSRRKGIGAKMGTCAWCDKNIPGDSEVFGFGAKARPGIDLKEREGETISLFLTLANKEVPAIVTVTGSHAKNQGNDLMFMACSQRCAKSLQEALKREMGIIDKLNVP